MARIEIDPNYSSPTFSRATAATDIFKKEDVQALAAAMSTHVHDGAGKGLALVAGSIPNGSITSAMIADGTIATADLAANAVTQRQYAIFGGAISTTSSAMALTGDQISITTIAGSDLLALMLFPVLLPAASGAVIQLAMYVDATLFQQVVKVVQANEVSTSWVGVGWCFVSGIAAGAHLVKSAWLTNTGTLNQSPIVRSLAAVEFKR